VEVGIVAVLGLAGAVVEVTAAVGCEQDMPFEDAMGSRPDAIDMLTDADLDVDLVLANVVRKQGAELACGLVGKTEAIQVDASLAGVCGVLEEAHNVMNRGETQDDFRAIYVCRRHFTCWHLWLLVYSPRARTEDV
jgi:hypothetical protein